MPAKPTAMQARAMELIRQGETPTAAMRKAGFSKQTSSAPKRNLLSTPGVQSLIETYRAEYAVQGIIPTYYVTKVKELIEAEKLDHSHTEPDQWVPDYQARAKGLEFYRKDMGLEQVQQSPNFVAGEMTVNFAPAKPNEPTGRDTT